MVFCLETEGSNGSYLEMMYVTCFSVYELKDPKVPYLKIGGSNGFLFRN